LQTRGLRDELFQCIRKCVGIIEVSVERVVQCRFRQTSVAGTTLAIPIASVFKICFARELNGFGLYSQNTFSSIAIDLDCRLSSPDFR